MRIYRLENAVQRYAWGSVDGIASVLGLPNPTGEPLAEIWMGAHPSAPSLAFIGKEKVGLDRLIQADPKELLGAGVVDSFGPNLPFLFKVLSAGSPLSIQTHPSKKKAEQGFERENLSGIPLDAPERSYRDANHKPELAAALTRFELLCGFRPVDEIIGNMKLAIPGEFTRALARLEREKSRVELSVFFYELMAMDKKNQERMLAAARKNLSGLQPGAAASSVSDEALAWVLRIMDFFPGDIGALAPLFLNHLVLEPGQAVFTAPGELHAHLSGTCLEIMANSDNVIRGGLTKKFIDLPELVSVLSFNPERILPVELTPISAEESSYPSFVPDFELSRISLGPGQNYRRRAREPEILLCFSGKAKFTVRDQIEELLLGRGESVFAAANAEDYEITANQETLLFRASVADLP